MHRLPRAPRPRPVTAAALGCLASVALTAHTARAAPVTWDVGAGGNGNAYDFVVDRATDWDGARAAARALGGDLATIDSAAEQSFVESVLSSGGAPTGSYWFGIRETGSEGVYRHVDGSPLGYTNWAPQQPDNSQGSESVGAVLWADAASAAADAALLAFRGGWNDAPVEGYPTARLVTPPAIGHRAGYLVELQADDSGGGGGNDGGGGTAVPLPAALYSFPAAAGIVGIFYRRMRRRG